MSRAQKTSLWVLFAGIAVLAIIRSRVEADPGAGKKLVPDFEARFNPSDQLLKEILDELRALRGDLQGALAAGQIRTNGSSVLTARCASCHTEGSEANTSGVVLVLKDGEVPAFSALERRHILEQVRTGKMPKGLTRLTAAEVKAVEVMLIKPKGGGK